MSGFHEFLKRLQDLLFDDHEDRSNYKALLFGLNYPSSENELNGCVNDVTLMSSILRKKFGHSGKDIKIRTDPDLIGDLDVLDYIQKSIQKLKHGDKLFVHYSGHGTQVDDHDGDELDGMDEAIYTHHGAITDDQIAEALMKIPKGVQVLLIFDCCNSGTICDLPYRYLNDRTSNLKKESDKRFDAEIISISGCKDEQTSADAWIRERQNYYGALTSSLSKIIDSEDLLNLSWKDLSKKLQLELKKAGYTQIPQICASSKSLLSKNVWL